MLSLVVMFRCESWTTKKAKHQRIDAFGLWYSKRLLRVPCTARRSNQTILKEISLEYSLEGLMLMLKLNLQYFGHIMQRTDTLEKTLMLGKIEGKRRWGNRGWDGKITKSVDMNLSKLQEIVKDKATWCSSVHRCQRIIHNLSPEQQRQQ